MNLILVWDQWDYDPGIIIRGIHPWESQGEYHHGYLGCFYWDIMGVSHENIMRIFSGNMMGRKKSSVSNFLIERCQLTHPILYIGVHGKEHLHMGICCHPHFLYVLMIFPMIFP
jgi:hypothetical protein